MQSLHNDSYFFFIQSFYMSIHCNVISVFVEVFCTVACVGSILVLPLLLSRTGCALKVVTLDIILHTSDPGAITPRVSCIVSRLCITLPQISQYPHKEGHTLRGKIIIFAMIKRFYRAICFFKTILFVWMRYNLNYFRWVKWEIQINNLLLETFLRLHSTSVFVWHDDISLQSWPFYRTRGLQYLSFWALMSST